MFSSHAWIGPQNTGKSLTSYDGLLSINIFLDIAGSQTAESNQWPFVSTIDVLH